MSLQPGVEARVNRRIFEPTGELTDKPWVQAQISESAIMRQLLTATCLAIDTQYISCFHYLSLEMHSKLFLAP